MRDDPGSPNATIVVMHDAINFRAGIDGAAAIARLVLEKDPMNGAIFVFRNRRGHMLRVLFYDGSGFWMRTKRLSKGCFSGWPTGDGSRRCSDLLARELQVLLWGSAPARVVFPELWPKVA